MPTLLPKKPLPLWVGIVILYETIQIRFRTKLARMFMYFTKWLSIAACRSLDIALRIAPWLDKSQQKNGTSEEPGKPDPA